MGKKKLIALIFIVAALSCVTTALAASGLQEIKAQLNYDINIIYNGQTQDMYDAAGTQVYPITYNGTTYVPVRAVSSIFGEAVEWDSASNSVILGSKDVQPVDLTKLSGLSGTTYSWVIRDASDLSVTGSDGVSTYGSGIAWSVWNGTYSVSKERLMYFPVDQKYSTVSFTVYSDVNCAVRLYDENYTVVHSFDVSAGQIVSKEIDISGISQLAFGADAKNAGNTGLVKVFDIYAK